MDRTLAVDGRVGRPGRIVTARRLLDERGVLAGLVIVALTFGALIGPQFFAAANIELMARGRLGPPRDVAEWNEHSLLMEASGARAS